MKILNEFQQGSLEWMIARAGIPTASEFDNLVTPDFKIRTGQMPATYLAKKVAEKWIGGPLAGFNTFDTEQGQILESEALPFYELQHEQDIRRVGLLTTDDGRIACSPDGMFEDGTGIEVKCPEAHTHVNYLLAGQLPKEYAAQVHGSMFVAEAESWQFFSYRRHFPPLVLTVERDEEIQKILAEALESFLARLDIACNRLVELNGGPPRRIPQKPSPVTEEEPQDVPH